MGGPGTDGSVGWYELSEPMAGLGGERIGMIIPLLMVSSDAVYGRFLPALMLLLRFSGAYKHCLWCWSCLAIALRL